MTAGFDDVEGHSAHALLALLARVTDGMMEIRGVLHKNPMVTEATRGCDVRYDRDDMPDEKKYVFEAYVEAETKTGDGYFWTLDLISTRRTWTIWRSVSKAAEGGAQSIIDFDDVTFDTVSELESNMASVMDAFVESARRFTF